MESIKRAFASNQDRGNYVKWSPTSPLANRDRKQQTTKDNPTGACHTGHATSNFIPQDRGRQETIEWLATGTSESLAALLTERDRAAKQAQHEPRTKGTEEVEPILKEPTYKNVKELHTVQRRTEMAVRYGVPGVVVYNFSRTLGWNRAAMSRLPCPPLQLRDFQARIREIKLASAGTPAAPYPPIDWLVLSERRAAQRPKLQKQLTYTEYDEMDEQGAYPISPISEPGGWRDGVDITDARPRLTLEISPDDTVRPFTHSEEGDEEGEYGPYDIDVMSATLSERGAIAVEAEPRVQ
ncbi:hypothetical protein F5Y10DRAFT_272787 [Nemania abortiva]|nr:hypothetical protein F5Y10DRAFT_272787 [Nemania abortiva]